MLLTLSFNPSNYHPHSYYQPRGLGIMLKSAFVGCGHSHIECRVPLLKRLRSDEKSISILLSIIKKSSLCRQSYQAVEKVLISFQDLGK